MDLLVMQVSDHNSELQETHLALVYAFSLCLLLYMRT